MYSSKFRAPVGASMYISIEPIQPSNKLTTKKHSMYKTPNSQKQSDQTVSEHVSELFDQSLHNPHIKINCFRFNVSNAIQPSTWAHNTQSLTVEQIYRHMALPKWQHTNIKDESHVTTMLSSSHKWNHTYALKDLHCAVHFVNLNCYRVQSQHTTFQRSRSSAWFHSQICTCIFTVSLVFSCVIAQSIHKRFQHN